MIIALVDPSIQDKAYFYRSWGRIAMTDVRRGERNGEFRRLAERQPSYIYCHYGRSGEQTAVDAMSRLAAYIEAHEALINVSE